MFEKEILEFYCKGKTDKEISQFKSKIKNFSTSFFNHNIEYHKSRIKYFANLFNTTNNFIKDNIIFKNPLFLLNYKNIHDYNLKIKEMAKIYNVPEKEIKIKILKYTQFIALDHEKRIKEIARIYNVPEKEIKTKILKHTQFIGYDHEKKIKEMARIYNVSEKEIKIKILKNTPFIGLDHNEILKINLRLGKLFNLSEQFIKKISLDYYFVNASNPYKKTALVDALRNNLNNKDLNKLALNYFMHKNLSKPTEKELLELKTRIILNNLNNKIARNKYTPFVDMHNFSKELQEKFSTMIKRQKGNKRYAISGVRETVSKRHGVNKTSKLGEYIKKTRFRVPK